MRRLRLVGLSVLVALATGASVQAGDGGALEVKDLIIERRNDRDRIVVELSGPAAFRVLPGNQGPARLEISGARVRPAMKRRFEGEAGSAVKVAEVAERGDRVTIDVQGAMGGSTTALREGNRIVLMFAGP